MSSLVAGFTAWMGKGAASAQGETTLSFKVFGGKSPKRFSPDEDAQKSPVVIVVDSSE